MSESCEFCDWVTGKKKAVQTVYEDESVLGVLCDSPVAKGHTLVLLKTHHCDLTSVEPEDAGHLGEVVARISSAIKLAFNPEMVYVASVGEVVQHVHYHLIPRYASDNKGLVHFLSDKGELDDAAGISASIKKNIRGRELVA